MKIAKAASNKRIVIEVVYLLVSNLNMRQKIEGNSNEDKSESSSHRCG